MRKTLLLALPLAIVGGVAATPAQAAVGDQLSVTNNGSYSRVYNDIAYTCGTDNVVLFSDTELAGSTGTNDDGTLPSTVTGTINTATGEMNWKYVREAYEATFVGTGVYNSVAKTFTFTQDATAPSTGGVLGATGSFTGVPSCATVPVMSADTCKNDGYKVLVDAKTKAVYKNQGLCVSAFHRV